MGPESLPSSSTAQSAIGTPILNRLLAGVWGVLVLALLTWTDRVECVYFGLANGTCRVERLQIAT